MHGGGARTLRTGTHCLERNIDYHRAAAKL